MQTRFITRLTPAFMMFVAGAAAAQDAPPTNLECMDQYVLLLKDCERDTPPAPDPGRESCALGAFDFLIACFEADDSETFVKLMNLFQDHLRRIAECRAQFPDSDDLYAACVEGSLLVLRREIQELLDGNGDGVPLTGDAAWSPVVIGGSSNTAALDVDTMTSVAPEDPNQLPEGTYTSIALMTYDTVDGVVTQIVAQDTDPSDGVSVELDLSQQDLQQANRIAVTILHLNEAGDILGLQGGVIELNNSDLAGDWNRDGVYDNDDLVTYIDGLVAGVDRADLNDDGVNDGVDLLEFAGQLP